VQKGFRESIRRDDSDVCNKVCEVVNAPETCIIKEDNSYFGGNVCEDYNKVCVDAEKNINDQCSNVYGEKAIYAGGNCGPC